MKILGYILAPIGLLLIAFSNELGREMLPFLQVIPASIMLIVGIVLTAVGVIFMLLNQSSKAEKEVPIYKGKKIVGYRRH